MRREAAATSSLSSASSAASPAARQGVGCEESECDDERERAEPVTSIGSMHHRPPFPAGARPATELKEIRSAPAGGANRKTESWIRGATSHFERRARNCG